jgi:hypothetical protein
VGPVNFANSKVIQRWNLPFVKLYGQVEYQEALRLQRSADLLVLIDMPVINPDLRVYFPSKLLDYIIAGPPILAIGDEGSEIQNTLREKAIGQYVVRNDMDKLVHCLDSAFKAGATPPRRQPHAAPHIYSAEYNAARLLELMQHLLKVQN